MDVAIGIPTYRGAPRLDYLLQSIYLTEYSPEYVPIAVVDDGSPPRASRQIRKVCEKWQAHMQLDLLVHEENMGICKSWNDLTQHFNSDIMVLLNDDVLVAKDWINCLVYFLENNKCGAVSLPFYFIKPEDAPLILKGENVTPRDPLTKISAPNKINEIREDMHPGILMCPAGNLFGFRREMYDLVDGFDERFKSFFEESDLGTKLAQKGYKSYGLTYPMCWHCWSQTFRENPELEAGATMKRSHMAYIEKWKVPKEYWEKPFEYTNPKFMSKIPRQKITWMGKKERIYWGWDS